MSLQPLGKILIGLGLLLVVLGFLLVSGRGTGWLGRLPGDVHVERPQDGFYFPIVTCIVLSAAFSLVMWILSRFR